MSNPTYFEIHLKDTKTGEPRLILKTTSKRKAHHTYGNWRAWYGERVTKNWDVIDLNEGK